MIHPNVGNQPQDIFAKNLQAFNILLIACAVLDMLNPLNHHCKTLPILPESLVSGIIFELKLALGIGVIPSLVQTFFDLVFYNAIFTIADFAILRKNSLHPFKGFRIYLTLGNDFHALSEVTSAPKLGIVHNRQCFHSGFGGVYGKICIGLLAQGFQKPFTFSFITQQGNYSGSETAGFYSTYTQQFVKQRLKCS